MLLGLGRGPLLNFKQPTGAGMGTVLLVCLALLGEGVFFFCLILVGRFNSEARKPSAQRLDRPALIERGINLAPGLLVSFFGLTIFQGDLIVKVDGLVELVNDWQV